MPGTTVGISLNLGYAGKVSRNPMNKIGSRFVKSILNINGVETQPSIPFGNAVVLNGDNSVSLFGATGAGVSAPTAANFIGIAIAEVKNVMTFSLGANNAAGAYEPTVPCDVLELGSATVFVTEGTYTAGGALWIVSVAGTSHVVGDFVATATPADGSTTIALTNVKLTTGKVDANGVAEVTILTQVNP
jgi:hypothetical protein